MNKRIAAAAVNSCEAAFTFPLKISNKKSLSVGSGLSKSKPTWLFLGGSSRGCTGGSNRLGRNTHFLQYDI